MKFDPHAAGPRLGFVKWQPRVRVEIVRPSASWVFLAISASVAGGLAAWAMYYPTQNIELSTAARIFGLAGFAAVPALGVVIFLQGLQPRRKMVFDWKNEAMSVCIAGRTTVHQLKDVRRLVLRSGHLHAQMDIVFSSGMVRLFESDDYGRHAFTMPLQLLEPLAEDLAKMLGAPLVDLSIEPEPFKAAGIWFHSSRAARWALLPVFALQMLAVGGLIKNPILAFLPVIVVGVGGIAGPVGAGIWLGMSLVKRGKKAKANLFGLISMAGGALLFALCAIGNRDGFWETFPGGEFLGNTGVYTGLGCLLFGMGMMFRNQRKYQDV